MVMGASSEGNTLDFNQELRAGQSADLEEGTGGRMGRIEKAVPDLSEGRESGSVRHERGEFDQAMWACPDRLEGTEQILEHLFGLSCEVILADQLALWIEGDLAGDENEVAARHHSELAVAAGGGQGGWIAELNGHGSILKKWRSQATS
jgi:hypothetical protein